MTGKKTSNPSIADLLSRAAGEADSGRQDLAFVLYGEALSIAPDDAEALKGAARALLAMRRLDDSAEAWQGALAVEPEDPETLFQCGFVYFRRGEMDAARSYFDRALTIDPQYYGALGMKLLSLLYDRSEGDDALWQAQSAWSDQRRPDPFVSHNNAGEDPDRPLRIGFVSSDFRAHSVGFNMLPVFQRLNRDAFRIYAYAELAHPDAATRLFESASDTWRSTVGMNDSQVASTIIDDEIDILVFLAGHLDENRPFVSRFRPAPVQVSHHDICSSTLPEIDYFIGDRYVTPHGGPERFTERVVRLPTFTVHSIPAEAGVPGPLPALDNGFFTFGSFNAPQKISEPCLEAWAAILNAVPGSRLLLKHFEAYSETATRARMLDGLAVHGIEAARVTILDEVDKRSAHLRAYDKVDIGLDSFPFSGATTTFEALLMGVPVVSLAGSRFVERCSAATLDAAGLGVCIAQDTDSYVSRAVELASNANRLAALRKAIPRILVQSRVCDADRYVRNMGRVYRAMWRLWCAKPLR